MIVLKGLFCNKTFTFLEFFLVYLLKKYHLNHNLPKNKFPKIPFTNLLKNTADRLSDMNLELIILRETQDAGIVVLNQ